MNAETGRKWRLGGPHTLREKVLIAALLGFGLMLLATTMDDFPFELYLLGLFLPSVVVLIDGMIHLWHQRWNPGVMHVTLLPLFVLVIYFIFSQPLVIFVTLESDDFAVGLKLPTDIPLYQPLRGPVRHDAADFDLVEEGQPGVYKAVILIEPPIAGNVHLKAFEITGNVPLSERSLNDRTRKHFALTPDTKSARRYEVNFTIYEGEWDQPYAARFEVWLTPDDKSPPIKLREKNFVIEGWMR